MKSFSRFKNRLIAKLITRWPALSKRFVEGFSPWETEDIPWSPLEKPLPECRIALVTTSGVHHTNQKPFDMHDPDGDPTMRLLDLDRPRPDFTITHDYYDHTDADRDLNVVLPLDRLRELAEEKRIGSLSSRAYSFMGHIQGRHLPTLLESSAPAAAARLREDKPDAVILTPG